MFRDVDELLAQRIERLIDDEPHLGYRMVWARLRMAGHIVNRNAVQLGDGRDVRVYDARRPGLFQWRAARALPCRRGGGRRRIGRRSAMVGWSPLQDMDTTGRKPVLVSLPGCRAFLP